LGVGGMGGAIKSAAPVGGQGVSNILLLSIFALGTAGPPLSLTPADPKRPQNTSKDFKRVVARISMKINENQ